MSKKHYFGIVQVMLIVEKMPYESDIRYFDMYLNETEEYVKGTAKFQWQKDHYELKSSKLL